MSEIGKRRRKSRAILAEVDELAAGLSLAAVVEDASLGSALSAVRHNLQHFLRGFALASFPIVAVTNTMCDALRDAFAGMWNEQ